MTKALLSSHGNKWRAVLLAFTLCGLVEWVTAAELTAVDAITSPGATALLPLSLLSRGVAISAIQFDVRGDDSLTIVVLAGGGITAAGKALYKARMGPGSIRCIIAGLSTQVLPDAEMVRVFVSPQPSTALGSYNVTLTNVIASTPDGRTVPTTARRFLVTVRKPADRELLLPSGIRNASSMLDGAIAPGEIVTVFGPGTQAVQPAAADTLALFVNNLQAPLLYVGSRQINAVVPFSIQSDEPGVVELRSQGATLASATVPVASVQPGIFTQDYSGTGAAAILNEDYTLNTHDHPATRGSIVMVYGTGFGQTDPPAADGEDARDARWVRSPVSAVIGGADAQVTYAGFAPGLITGLTQINVRVPQNAPQGAAVPLTLRANAVNTQPGITVSVR